MLQSKVTLQYQSNKVLKSLPLSFWGVVGVVFVCLFMILSNRIFCNTEMVAFIGIHYSFKRHMIGNQNLRHNYWMTNTVQRCDVGRQINWNGIKKSRLPSEELLQGLKVYLSSKMLVIYFPTMMFTGSTVRPRHARKIATLLIGQIK